MTKSRLGLAGILVLMMAIAIWAVLPNHRDEPSTVAKPAVAERTELVRRAQPGSGDTKPVAARGVDMLTRPPAKVAARNARRVRFSDLKRLGASDEVINRLTDGDFSAVFEELKQRAQRGDAEAANILERLARFDCGFARNSVQSRAAQIQQSPDTRALSTPDAEWIRIAIDDKDLATQKMASACEGIDKDAILGWVTRAADQGNGASRMFLSLPSGVANSRAARQQRLQEAVQSGYPEAESFLAQGIVNGMSDIPSGASVNVVQTLLEDAAKTLPYAESELAICEFTGCPGIEPDIPSAVAHAREAAQRGNFDAMNEIGPKLQASQIDPDEVQAWGLVAAALAQQGCSSNSLSVQNMTSWTSALSSKTVSSQAKSLAEGYWRDYGAQMMSNIGCL